MKAAFTLSTNCSIRLLIVLMMFACVRERTTSLSYPTPVPDSTALRFLPGVVSTDSLDFNAAFSNDGKTFYFSKGRRAKWVINEIHLDARDSLTYSAASFSENQYSQADPFITSDGTLYYISNRPENANDTSADYNIWRVHPLPDGSWSSPEYVEGVNTDSTEYYVSVAKNGNLYFASNRDGGLGGLDLYMSEIVNGAYSAPKNLGPQINTSGDEHDPLPTPDEQYLIFTSDARDDSFGEADLYFAQNKGGNWSTPENLGPTFNTTTYEYCPNFSPDGKYFFYSSEYDVKWISSSALPFNRPQCGN